MSDRTAVNPAVPTRFRALQHRNFQLFIAGQLISLIGTWMQTTAQLWLIYELTGSAAFLGVLGFASQVPMLFLSSLGGYVGDRYDRKRGVIATQSASMILAFVLAALKLTNIVNKWEVLVIAFLVGIVNAFDVPIRQAFFVQMVGKEDLPNAIALNSSIFNGARVVGPAMAGFAIAWFGEGWCFLRPAFRGAHPLQGARPVDCGDVHDLRSRPDHLFAGKIFLVVRRGAFRRGLCGDLADGRDQHADPESST